MRAFINIPRTPYEGFTGTIKFADGRKLRVLNKQICEPAEYGGAFTHDYFAFETRAECEAAVRRKVAELKRAGR